MKGRAPAVLAAMILLLAGCQADTPGTATEPAAGEEEERTDVVNLSVATTGNWENTLRGELFDQYTRELSDWSGGKLKMKIYDNAQLGTDLELIAGVQEGTLNIVNLVPSYQISAVPEAALLDIPGFFDTTEEFNYFIDHYYLDTLQEFYHAAGIRLLTCSAFTYRQLTSTREIASIRDLQGLQLRTMENKYQSAFWQFMGATVIPLSYREVRLSIQRGILEAQENPIEYMISGNLADVQGYVTLTNHVPMVSTYLMNEEQYEALSEENQELLQRFMDEMEEELRNREPEREEEILEELREQGITVTEASADIRQGIEEGGERVIEMLREDLGDEVVDDFLVRAEEAKTADRNEN